MTDGTHPSTDASVMSLLRIYLGWALVAGALVGFVIGVTVDDNHGWFTALIAFLGGVGLSVVVGIYFFAKYNLHLHR